MSRGRTCKPTYSILERGEEAENVGLSERKAPDAIPNPRKRKSTSANNKTVDETVVDESVYFASTTIGSTFISGTL
ncbi:hypothetical protein E1B28_002645 [Marasmius oreades]|uniref:Uncharacterized protein n=1 Tax=Marasmius oreades TaxID=181124 RepID=A0A9P7RNA5_9AGAR|nr:uncharacterized protein E1B28_002645 [Marasmius oreades]KAG7086709.1 hypothetical protein E1B28_002645 [Marasmius oreades]